ncbi:hypothetical protein [Cellulomonas endometrii]|nr:hypothetical protein [Cellulomonas endometrii]
MSKRKTLTLEGSIEDNAVRPIEDPGDIDVRRSSPPEPVHF